MSGLWLAAGDAMQHPWRVVLIHDSGLCHATMLYPLTCPLAQSPTCHALHSRANSYQQLHSNRPCTWPTKRQIVLKGMLVKAALNHKTRAFHGTGHQPRHPPATCLLSYAMPCLKITLFLLRATRLFWLGGMLVRVRPQTLDKLRRLSQGQYVR
ncbi:hypothetical protein BD413DRAFT_134169 [Trametes elegans]|nr:hypothetical protein BD413DRAFT_134169 [Trametes elegans]